jgi:RNA ligase
MNYKFPEIRTIEDVLPYIEGRDEFIVAEREGYTVVNYVVSMQDTFNMSGPDDIGGAIRRECRGLIFDADGNIMSRPFHKFFNVNEREETQDYVLELEMRSDHVVMEKMDGSMIRPILLDGELRLATKMGVTTVAIQAEEWLDTQSADMKTWLRKCVEDCVTPLLEWVSPFNQIVLAYEEANLVYLGTRDNTTGAYLMDKSCPFDAVPQYGAVEGNIVDYVALARQAQSREGDIIRFANGHMVKVKNDWYVRIHKTLDRIVFDRNIVSLIINEEVDDVIPMLPKAQASRVRDFEISFWSEFAATEERLMLLFLEAQMLFGDRKRIALELVPTLKHRGDAQFIFRMLDGNSCRDLLLEHIRKHVSTNSRWNTCAEWMKN